MWIQWTNWSESALMCVHIHYYTITILQVNNNPLLRNVNNKLAQYETFSSCNEVHFLVLGLGLCLLLVGSLYNESIQSIILSFLVTTQ